MIKREENKLSKMEVHEMMRVNGGAYPVVPNLGPYIIAQAVASWVAKHL